MNSFKILKSMYNKELKFAIQAIKKAEPTFLKYFGTKTQVETKGKSYRDLVSLADKKIEEEIRSFLSKQFPKYGFIGEEQGHINTLAEYVWVLDPIDGTVNYIQGLTDCSISLALLKNNKPIIGVVYMPLLKKLYTAERRLGAKLNGNPIHVSKVSDIKQSMGGLGWGKSVHFAARLVPKLVTRVRKIRIPGSATVGICNVAQGSYDFLITKSIKVWDYAASQLILEEAGGVFKQFPDSELFIISNKNLSQILIRRLSEWSKKIPPSPKRTGNQMAK